MTERHVQRSTCGVLRTEVESRNIPTLADEPYVGDCVADSLADTRARLAAGGPREIDRLAEFFHRHAITIHEHRRGDPPEAVRPLLSLTLDHLVRGTLKLQLGETAPLNDVLSAPPSAPAEPPPPADAEPRPEPFIMTADPPGLGPHR